MPLVLLLPENYPYALMGLAANYLFCFICNPLFVMPARKQAFSEENLKAHKELHETTFPGTEIDKMGNPDQGNGWYSKTLSLKDYVKINSAQRIIWNYLEAMPYLIIETIIAGLMYSNITVGCVWAFLLGRIMYAFGFAKAPQFRGPGFMIGMLAVMTLHVLCILTFIQFFKMNVAN